MSTLLPYRVAYVVVPHLPVAVERRDRPPLAARPVIIADARTPAQVLDGSVEALSMGVRPGMSLGQAERLCPEALFLPPRPDRYRQASAALFELLCSQMPIVEQAQPGGFYLGLAGLERHDDEALTLCRQQSEAIGQELRLATAAGVAANKFTAEAASLAIGLNRALAMAPGTERSFLSGFPVALLPISDETRRRLHLFGLRRMGQFARLPPAAALAQFGWEGQRAHRLARGQDDRPVVAGHGERSETIARAFDPPLDNLETLVAVAGRLVTALSRRLVALFLRAGQVDLLVTCADGAALAARRVLAEPTIDAARLTRLTETLLRPLRYPGPVSELALTLGDLSTPSVHQLSLWPSVQERAAETHLARLAARYGPTCFHRSVLVDPAHRLASRRFTLTSGAYDDAPLA